MAAVSKDLLDTFDRLDLTIGNGLIGKNQLVLPASKALFIGIGGTGTDALRRLKRLVYQRYLDIDKYFAFIGIDTDDREPVPHNNYLRLEKNEKVLITHDNGKKFFGERTLLPDHITGWLSPNITLSDATKGAGSFRQVGRAMLFHNSGKVIGAVRSAFERIMKGTGGAFVEVFIFAGLGGGTGSGSMLDIGYMVRGIAEKIPTDQYNIHGYIFMPDINASVEGLPQVARDALRPNAYAALKEIDYWMNIEARKDTFTQKYDGTFTVSSGRPPFDLCFPISTQNAAGQVLEDAYMESMTVAAETVCQFISYKEESGQGDTFVQSFINNTYRYAGDRMDDLRSRRQTKLLPVYNKYTVCGSAIRRLPVAAINTYLACLLFQRIHGIYENAYNQNIPAAITAFCGPDGHQLDSVSLRERVSRKFMERGIMIPDFAGWSWDDLFTTNATADQFSEYNRNLTNVMNEIQISLSDEILARIDDDFKAIFTDPKRGPYWLNVFIQNDNTGLIAQLDSYKRNVRDEAAAYGSLSAQLLRDESQARSDGSKSLLPMKGRHVRNYSTALYNRFKNRGDEATAVCCEKIYAIVNDVLQKRVSASYRATYNVLDALSKVFETNMDTFNAQVKREREPGKVVYSWDIFTLPEIVTLVRRTLNERGVTGDSLDSTVSGFFRELFDLINNEIRKNEITGGGDLNDVEIRDVNIIDFMADFLTREFDFLVDQTIADYLEKKASDEGKEFSVYMQDLFEAMSRDSLPLFNQSPPDDYWLRYAPLPNIRGDKIKNAWEEFSKNKNALWSAKPSVSRDTFVFMTIGCGVMLYESNLLDTAETEYEAKKEGSNVSPSLHLCRAIEWRDANGRMVPYKDDEIKLVDWLYLPPIRPLDERTVTGKYGEQEASARQTVQRLFDRGVIRRVGRENVYYSKACDADSKPVAVEQIIKKMDGGKITHESPVRDVEAYRQKLGHLKNYMTGVEDAPHNLLEIFGLQFTIVNVPLTARYNEAWTGIEEKEMFVLYARSLNIQRDTRNIGFFLDGLDAELERVDGVLSAFGATEVRARLVVHGFRCGKLVKNGSVFQLTMPDGETEILARGGGVDTYPVFALYERLGALKNFDKIEAYIRDAYNKAVDSGTFDTESFETLKNQLKRDEKLADERKDETSDKCRLFYRYAGRAIDEIEEDCDRAVL